MCGAFQQIKYVRRDRNRLIGRKRVYPAHFAAVTVKTQLRFQPVDLAHHIFRNGKQIRFVLAYSAISNRVAIARCSNCTSRISAMPRTLACFKPDSNYPYGHKTKKAGQPQSRPALFVSNS